MLNKLSIYIYQANAGVSNLFGPRAKCANFKLVAGRTKNIATNIAQYNTQ